MYVYLYVLGLPAKKQLQFVYGDTINFTPHTAMSTLTMLVVTINLTDLIKVGHQISKFLFNTQFKTIEAFPSSPAGSIFYVIKLFYKANGDH